MDGKLLSLQLPDLLAIIKDALQSIPPFKGQIPPPYTFALTTSPQVKEQFQQPGVTFSDLFQVFLACFSIVFPSVRCLSPILGYFTISSPNNLCS